MGSNKTCNVGRKTHRPDRNGEGTVNKLSDYLYPKLEMRNYSTSYFEEPYSRCSWLSSPREHAETGTQKENQIQSGGRGNGGIQTPHHPDSHFTLIHNSLKIHKTVHTLSGSSSPAKPRNIQTQVTLPFSLERKNHMVGHLRWGEQGQGARE